MSTPDTTHVYRCELTFWEHVFFSSREISNFFQTEPLLGNYALAYALGLAQSPYHSDGPVRYALDLGPLNERGVYVTPGTILGEPRFVLSQFNAQADAYWYAFTNNAIVVRSDGERAVRQGSRCSASDASTPGWRRIRPPALMSRPGLPYTDSNRTALAALARSRSGDIPVGPAPAP